MTECRGHWRPIDTAPIKTPVIVTDRHRWTLARHIQQEVQTLQLRWPFIKYETQWAWIFSCSGYRRIDFEPSHWMLLEIEPPAIGLGEGKQADK